MAYTKTTWANGGTPAINETNLNHLEQGVSDCDTNIDTVEADILQYKRRLQLGVDI